MEHSPHTIRKNIPMLRTQTEIVQDHSLDIADNLT